jgi:hypothetical protein
VLEGISNPERRVVSESELSVMRTRLRELLAQWKALNPGESLKLSFPRIE